MAVKMTVEYKGQLHCDLVHEDSGTRISTDAPKDNNGLGESFSPTDLVGAALISCATTIMAIKARKEDIPFSGAKGYVVKEMTTSPPRRIARLSVVFELPESVRPEHRPRLEEFARTCPVALSIHPSVDMTMSFEYR